MREEVALPLPFANGFIAASISPPSALSFVRVSSRVDAKAGSPIWAIRADKFYKQATARTYHNNNIILLRVFNCDVTLSFIMGDDIRIVTDCRECCVR